MYSWDRAAAIAFSTVAETPLEGRRLSDDKVKELSKRLKVYLTLRSLNGFADGYDEEPEDFDAEWAAHTPSLRSLLGADVRSIRGPATGRSDPGRIKALVDWFREIVAEVDSESAAEEDTAPVAMSREAS
jgi:hypothetical protein